MVNAPLPRHLALVWRAQLREESLLSLDEAAEAMPGDPRLALGWIPANVKVAGEWAGQPVYRWGDVAAAIASGGQWLTQAEAAKVAGVSRSSLDAMLAKAPKNLPGAPMHVGEGQQREHKAWEASRVREWVAAYRAWEAGEKPVAKIARRRPASKAAAAEEEKPVDWVKVARAARGR